MSPHSGVLTQQGMGNYREVKSKQCNACPAGAFFCRESLPRSITLRVQARFTTGTLGQWDHGGLAVVHSNTAAGALRRQVLRFDGEWGDQPRRSALAAFAILTGLWWLRGR